MKVDKFTHNWPCTYVRYSPGHDNVNFSIQGGGGCNGWDGVVGEIFSAIQCEEGLRYFLVIHSIIMMSFILVVLSISIMLSSGTNLA